MDDKTPTEKAVATLEPGLVAFCDEMAAAGGGDNHWRDAEISPTILAVLLAVKRYGDERERKAR